MLNIGKNRKNQFSEICFTPSKHWGQSYIAIGVGCLQITVRVTACKIVGRCNGDLQIDE